MKLINLFDGSIDKSDASELLNNWIQSYERLEFKNLMEKVTNDYSLVPKILDHLFHVGKEMFEDIFTGYSKDQINYIFINKAKVKTLLTQQVKELTNVTTIYFWGIFVDDEHINTNHYECKDCYDDFYDKDFDPEQQGCPNCGGRIILTD